MRNVSDHQNGCLVESNSSTFAIYSPKYTETEKVSLSKKEGGSTEAGFLIWAILAQEEAISVEFGQLNLLYKSDWFWNTVF